jgi:hypothetical protein
MPRTTVGNEEELFLLGCNNTDFIINNLAALDGKSHYRTTIMFIHK